MYQEFQNNNRTTELPVDVLIKDVLKAIRGMRQKGVAVGKIAGLLEVSPSTVFRWLDGSSIPHKPYSAGHSVYDYARRIPKTEGLVMSSNSGGNLAVLEKAIDTRQEPASKAIFADISRDQLIKNFVGIVKELMAQYSIPFNGEETLSKVFNCHRTTITNWRSGRTSPHGISLPNTTIYHRIDMLRAEYGSVYDSVLRGNGEGMGKVHSESELEFETAHKLQFIALCKTLKHLREKTDCVSHKELAEKLGVYSHTLHQYVTLIRGEWTGDIPSPEQLQVLLKKFRTAYGYKYDYMLKNRNNTDLLPLLNGKKEVRPSKPVDDKLHLGATVYERRQAKGEITIAEAKARLETELAEAVKEEEDIVTQQVYLEARLEQVQARMKTLTSDIGVLNKLGGVKTN